MCAALLQPIVKTHLSLFQNPRLVFAWWGGTYLGLETWKILESRKSKSSKMGCVLFVEVFVGFLEWKMLRDVKLQANPFFSSQSKVFGNVRRNYEIWWKELEFLDWNQFKRHISLWFVWVKWVYKRRWSPAISWFIPRFERRTFRTLSGRQMQGGM